MKRTTICSFVLSFVLGGAAFAEAPKNDPKQSAVENTAGEKAIDQTTLGEFTWRGKLVDQACKEKRIDQTCPVTSSTERFGLVIDGGTIVPLDEAGNEKAKKLVGPGYNGNVEVSLVGARQGGVFQVESIEARRQ